MRYYESELAELVRAAPTPAHGRNVAREYLQARILGALQRAGAMIPLAFYGAPFPVQQPTLRPPAATVHPRSKKKTFFAQETMVL